MMGMGMLAKFTGYTGVKLLVTNYLGNDEVRKVYDKGNGAYIKSQWGTPRYIKNGGALHNPEFRECNGDPVKWDVHIGDVDTLTIKGG